jgi:uncharacterized membrane protein HdeD (DUF308 family)
VICIGFSPPEFLVPSVKPTVFYGSLLLAGGIPQIISSLWTGKRSGMLLHLLIGVLYTVLGLLIFDSPTDARWPPLSTTLVAIFLIESGIFRIVGALTQRFHAWGWVLLNGGVTLLLGLLIYRAQPYQALRSSGLFVGIEMLFNGWAWIMLALRLRATATPSFAAQFSLRTLLIVTTFIAVVLGLVWHFQADK